MATALPSQASRVLDAVGENRRLRALIASLQSGVLVEDETRHIVLVNQRFCEMFRIPAPPDAMVGVDCSGAAEQSKGAFVDPVAFVERIQCLLRDRVLVTGDLLELQDGRFLERDYVPVFEAEVYLGHVWHYRDVTEQHRTLRELARSNRELERFANVIAHDLRAPLRGISGHAEMLEEDLRDGADAVVLAAHVEHIVQGSKRLADMLGALLHYSRVGRAASAREAVDMGEVLAQACNNLDALIRERSAVVEAVTPLPTVSGHFFSLVHVMQNLVANAIQHSDASPHVRIGASGDGDSGWELFVSDNGPGIGAEDASKIFEVFQRGGAPGHHDGHGIGLSIVRRVVESHGGRVWVDPPAGRGATFRFTLLAQPPSDVRP